jgi:hypothetical protein
MRGAGAAADADGKPLAVGDRIEALPNGRGSKYSPGAVSAVHRSRDGATVTFGIDYDDGTFEDAALPTDVFRVDSAPPRGRPQQQQRPGFRGGAGLEDMGAPRRGSDHGGFGQNNDDEELPYNNRDTGGARTPGGGHAQLRQGPRTQYDDFPGPTHGDADRNERKAAASWRSTITEPSPYAQQQHPHGGHDNSFDSRGGGRPPVSVSWPQQQQGQQPYPSGAPMMPFQQQQQQQGFPPYNYPPQAPYGVGPAPYGNAMQPSPSAFGMSGNYGAPVAQPPPPTGIASFGRLCRELAAVRARARPILWEAFIATTRAKAQAADPYFGGGVVVPVARDVEAWLMGCLRRAAEQDGDPLARRFRDLLSTSTVRNGLASAGYAPTRDALAVLRSAFRVRSEHGTAPASLQPFPQVDPHEVRRYLAEEEQQHLRQQAARIGDPKEHAAILVAPLAFLLTADEASAAAVLAAMDEQSQRRTGHARPAAMSAFPLQPLDASLANFQLQQQQQLMLQQQQQQALAMQGAPGGWSTPMRASPGAGGGLLGSPQHHPQMLYPPQQQSAAALTASSYFMGGGAPTPGGGALAAYPRTAPVPRSVGDFLRTQATGLERDNLVSLLSTVVDFEQRLGLPQPHGAMSASANAGAIIPEGGDSCILALGPRLRIGLRFYVAP